MHVFKMFLLEMKYGKNPPRYCTGHRRSAAAAAPVSPLQEAVCSVTHFTRASHAARERASFNSPQRQQQHLPLFEAHMRGGELAD